jgi:hypothetical protein
MGNLLNAVLIGISGSRFPDGLTCVSKRRLVDTLATAPDRRLCHTLAAISLRDRFGGMPHFDVAASNRAPEPTGIAIERWIQGAADRRRPQRAAGASRRRRARSRRASPPAARMCA